MTRINLVPVRELTQPHLVAEYREIARVPALALAAYNRGETPADHPQRFTLGEGHVRFFYSRLGFVEKRFTKLVVEMQRRGYNVTYLQLAMPVGLPKEWWRDYRPTALAMSISRGRISERLKEMKHDKAISIPNYSQATE
jgi:deoxyribonuclease (pyrimidine dimer)